MHTELEWWSHFELRIINIKTKLISFARLSKLHQAPGPADFIFDEMQTTDVELDENSPREFLLSRHAKFLQHYVTNKKVSFEQMMVEYLKMSGIYWTNTALQLIDSDFDSGMMFEHLVKSFIQFILFVL